MVVQDEIVSELNKTQAWLPFDVDGKLPPALNGFSDYYWN